MRILQGLIQGSQEWIDIRLEHFNASEAPMMMNESKYASRNDLLDHKKGWTTKVDEFTQRIFDAGHAAEEAARPIVEKLIGKDLYPVVGVCKKTGFLASFDGLDMADEIVFEHKMWNKTLAENVLNNLLEPTYYWQLEQQLLVSKAEKAIFVVSDGTEENMEYMWYESVPERREALIAGWKQFAIDLETHELKAKTEKVKAEVINSLPVLNIQIKGEVIASNMDVYKADAMTYIDSVSTELSTDQDFANADSTVKFFDKSEKALEQAKVNALGQTASINDVLVMIDQVKDAMRNKRLELNKQVKARKEQIKNEVVLDGQQKLSEHISKLNKEIAPYTIPNYAADFTNVVKGKRTVESLQNAVDSELAKAKIATSEKAQDYKANIELFNDIASDKPFLFPDLQQHLDLDSATFETVITARITKHDEESKAKAEAELLAKQQAEQAALEAEQAEKVEVEITNSEEPEAAPESTLVNSQPLGLKMQSEKLNKAFGDSKSAFIPKELSTSVFTFDSSKPMFSPSHFEQLLTDENGNQYEVEVIARRKCIKQVKAA